MNRLKQAYHILLGHTSIIDTLESEVWTWKGHAERAFQARQASSDALGKAVQDRLLAIARAETLAHTVETLERKIEELKKQLRRAGNESD
jgi:uncharacterized protein YukE